MSLREPSVSVVMLCYNHEKYLQEAVQSVLSQSFTDIELILVDDGSKDSSLALARSFADERLKVISKRNGGPSDASQVGVSMARAPLIALMSADDICHPDRIKIQVEEIEKYLAGVTFCRPALLDDDGMSLPDHRWPIFFKRSFASQEDLYRILFDKGNFICATSVMFRSQLIEQFGYLHHGLIQLQDLLLWAQWLPHTRFHCSEHRYLFYRIRDGDGNLSSKINQWRTNFEKRIVYSNFFIGVNRSFLAKIFDDQISLESSDVVFEAQKAKLLLAHRDPIIKKLGAEKLVDLLRTKENSDVLDVELGIRVRDLYQQIGNIIDARRSQPLERRFSLKSLRGKFRSQK